MPVVAPMPTVSPQPPPATPSLSAIDDDNESTTTYLDHPDDVTIAQEGNGAHAVGVFLGEAGGTKRIRIKTSDGRELIGRPLHREQRSGNDDASFVKDGRKRARGTGRREPESPRVNDDGPDHSLFSIDAEPEAQLPRDPRFPDEPGPQVAAQQPLPFPGTETDPPSLSLPPGPAAGAFPRSRPQQLDIARPTASSTAKMHPVKFGPKSTLDEPTISSATDSSDSSPSTAALGFVRGRSDGTQRQMPGSKTPPRLPKKETPLKPESPQGGNGGVASASYNARPGRRPGAPRPPSGPPGGGSDDDGKDPFPARPRRGPPDDDPPGSGGGGGRIVDEASWNLLVMLLAGIARDYLADMLAIRNTVSQDAQIGNAASQLVRWPFGLVQYYEEWQRRNPSPTASPSAPAASSGATSLSAPAPASPAAPMESDSAPRDESPPDALAAGLYPYYGDNGNPVPFIVRRLSTEMLPDGEVVDALERDLNVQSRFTQVLLEQAMATFDQRSPQRAALRMLREIGLALLTSFGERDAIRRQFVEKVRTQNDAYRRTAFMGLWIRKSRDLNARIAAQANKVIDFVQRLLETHDIVPKETAEAETQADPQPLSGDSEEKDAVMGQTATPVDSRSLLQEVKALTGVVDEAGLQPLEYKLSDGPGHVFYLFNQEKDEIERQLQRLEKSAADELLVVKRQLADAKAELATAKSELKQAKAELAEVADWKEQKEAAIKYLGQQVTLVEEAKRLVKDSIATELQKVERQIQSMSEDMKVDGTTLPRVPVFDSLERLFRIIDTLSMPPSGVGAPGFARDAEAALREAVTLYRTDKLALLERENRRLKELAVSSAKGERNYDEEQKLRARIEALETSKRIDRAAHAAELKSASEAAKAEKERLQQTIRTIGKTHEANLKQWLGVFYEIIAFAWGWHDAVDTGLFKAIDAEMTVTLDESDMAPQVSAVTLPDPSEVKQTEEIAAAVAASAELPPATAQPDQAERTRLAVPPPDLPAVATRAEHGEETFAGGDDDPPPMTTEIKELPAGTAAVDSLSPSDEATLMRNAQSAPLSEAKEATGSLDLFDTRMREVLTGMRQKLENHLASIREPLAGVLSQEPAVQPSKLEDWMYDLRDKVRTKLNDVITRTTALVADFKELKTLSGNTQKAVERATTRTKELERAFLSAVAQDAKFYGAIVEAAANVFPDENIRFQSRDALAGKVAEYLTTTRASMAEGVYQYDQSLEKALREALAETYGWEDYKNTEEFKRKDLLRELKRTIQLAQRLGTKAAKTLTDSLDTAKTTAKPGAAAASSPAGGTAALPPRLLDVPDSVLARYPDSRYTRLMYFCREVAGCFTTGELSVLVREDCLVLSGAESILFDIETETKERDHQVKLALQTTLVSLLASETEPLLSAEYRDDEALFRARVRKHIESVRGDLDKGDTKLEDAVHRVLTPKGASAIKFAWTSLRAREDSPYKHAELWDIVTDPVGHARELFAR
jgi:hypothetical protein